MTEPPELPELVHVASCTTTEEAQLYQGLLEQEGIPSSVHPPNDPLRTSGQAAELLVPKAFEERAIELLEEVSKGSAEALIGDAWKQNNGDQADDSDV
ncbi:MAG: DUF2007 domain-containing protein [Myxococcota bacterium]